MHSFLTDKITRNQLDQFISLHANDKRTLDIGCANSPYSEFFPNRVGFDIQEGKGVDVVGDAHSLPFPDKSFEQIICTEVLEHLHTPQTAIDEMYRVLKPGGKVVLTTRFIFPLHDVPGDYFRFTKYGLRHLFRNWEIEDLREEVGTMETIGVLLQRLAFQVTLRGGAVSKLILLIAAQVVLNLQFLVRKEYGMRSKIGVREEQHILSSGYYVVATRT